MNAGHGLPDTLLKLHREHVAAWRDLDLDRLAELYDPAAIIYDTYAPPAYASWSEFRARIEPELSRFERFELETFDPHGQVEDDLGWIASRYRIRAVREARPYATTGRWTEVYRRRNGAWRLVHLHSSIDPPS